MTEARGGKRSNKKQPPLYNEVGLANHFKTAEAPMDDLSLAHSRYNCTYHIVFIPKYRRKVMFGELRKEIGEIIGKVCKMEGVTIIKAATLPDHVHMYVSIPPKMSVAKVVGRIKGKSSLMIFDKHPEYRQRYDRHFWARGYYCETVGNVNEETIMKYIAEQYERDRLEGDPEK